MYARTTTIQGAVANIDAGIAHVRDVTLPAVSNIPGCLGMSLLVDRASGRCIATTAWESEAAMRESAQQVIPLRQEAERVFGASTSTVDVWEIAVVHRNHAAPEGTGARVTWLSGDPSVADRAVDAFKTLVLPRLEALDGFCSASLFINHEAGRAVGTATYNDMARLEGSREATARIRESVLRETGANLDDLAEMEVALAHLHVPELV